VRLESSQACWWTKHQHGRKETEKLIFKRKIVNNRLVLTIILSLVTLGLGYWIGTIKTSVDEKFAIVDDLVEEVEEESNGASMDRSKEDFESFIYKFIADSIFQLERIKFPLKNSIQTGINEVETSSIKRSDWKIERLFGRNEYKAQIYDNFEREMRDTDERLFCWEGIENGIYVEYKFNRIGGQWFLIEFNDFSD
jgi:hypothetical protein